MQPEATVGILDEFQTELVGVWRRLPNKGFFLVLLAGWLTLFQLLGNSTFGWVASPSLYRWMLDVYLGHDPDGTLRDDSIGLWIPFLVLALFWWKRKELIELPVRIWWPGLLMLVVSMGFHVVGYVTQEPRLSVVALLGGIYGLMGLAWGPAWLRGSLFPFVLLVFCIPFATLIGGFTFKLRLLACGIVEWISHNLLAIEVVRSGTILSNPKGHYQYDVEAACSGIRSLVAIGLMSVVASFLFFRSWWRRGILWFSAAPLAIAGNVLRLLTIIIAAEIGGQEWGAKVHDGGPYGIFSLLPYIPAILGLIALTRWMGEPATTGKTAVGAQAGYAASKRAGEISGSGVEVTVDPTDRA